MNSVKWLPLRGDPSVISQFLFIAYAIFLAGFFFIPNAVDQYKLYSVSVFVAGIIRAPMGLRLVHREPLFLLIVSYLVYMFLSAFWSTPFVVGEMLDYGRLGLYILIFVLTTVFLHYREPERFDLLLRLVCAVAGVSALLSILLWYREHPFPTSRLISIGILQNPNPSAFVYGLFALVADRSALLAGLWGKRVWYTGLALVLLVFVLLTQSRTALLAVAIGLAILLVAMSSRKAVLGMGLVLGLAMGAFGLVGLVAPDWLTHVVNVEQKQAAVGARWEVWQGLFVHVGEAPWFGHGYLNELAVHAPSVNLTYHHAHSAYLATLRDGGVTGLVVLLALLGFAVWRALRLGVESGDYLYLALLLYGMLCMLADTDKLITRPRELWIIIWLPLSLLMGHWLLHRRSMSSSVS